MLGFVLVFFLFPKRDREVELLQQYHDTDTANDDAASTGTASAGAAATE